MVMNKPQREIQFICRRTIYHYGARTYHVLRVLCGDENAKRQKRNRYIRKKEGESKKIRFKRAIIMNDAINKKCSTIKLFSAST